MITINLEEPAALETLSELQLRSARLIELGENFCLMKHSAKAKEYAARGDRLNKIAMAIQTAIVSQREPRQVRRPQAAGD